MRNTDYSAHNIYTMATSNFIKAVKKAKVLYKTGKYLTFGDAVKAAHKSIGSGKLVNRQTGTSNKASDMLWKAKKPGKRKSARGATYYERRKNRSDKPGQITGLSLNSDKLHVTDQLKRLVSELSLMDGKIFIYKQRLKNVEYKKDWPLYRKNIAWWERQTKVTRANISNLKKLI